MKLLDDAIRWAWQNAEKQTDIVDFIDNLDVSAGYFSRLFHVCMHMTFSEYYRRVIAYLTLLEVSESGSVDAVIKNGFASLNRFKQVTTLDETTDITDVDPETYRPVKTYTTVKTLSLPEKIVTVEPKDFLGFLYRGHNPEIGVLKQWEKLENYLPDLRYDHPKYRSGLMAPIRDSDFELNNPSKGAFSYFCCQEVEGFTTSQKPFVYRLLPKRRFLRFTHTDAIASLNDTYKYIFSKRLVALEIDYDEDYIYEIFEETPDGLLVHIHVPIKTEDDVR